MTAEIVSFAAFRTARGGGQVMSGSSLLKQKLPEERANGMAAMLSRQEQRWVDHRSEPRHPVQGKCLPALTLGGTAASLENVSKNGLMVSADLTASPGSRVVVSLAGCRPLSARVIWKRDGVIGLEAPLGSMELQLV
jgi:hypothetical protein